MKARKFFAFVAAVGMLFAGGGCTPNQEGEPATSDPLTHELSSESMAVLSSEEKVETIELATNGNWNVVVPEEHSDIVVTPLNGTGNATVTVTVPAYEGERMVTLTFNFSKKTSYPVVGVIDEKESLTFTISQNADGEAYTPISSITEVGTYKIGGALVVALSTQSFIVTDSSGANIAVYRGYNVTMPSIGDVVNVSGDVVEYKEKLQFDKTATVNTTGRTDNVDHGTPLDLTTYEAFKAFADDLTISYVEIKGLLKISGTFYNLYVDGKDGYDDMKGSIYSPVTEIANKLSGWNEGYVIVRGYAIYVNSSVFVNIIPVSVELDASKPILKAENISNVSATGVTDGTHNIVALGVQNVTANPDGVIVTAASVSGNVLTYTVAENTGDARQGTITLSAEGVNDVVVSVFQKGVPTGGEGNTVDDVLDLAFTGVSGTNYTDWSNKTGESGAVYAGQSAGGNESIQLRSKNSNSGVISTTSAGKVRKVVVTWNANTSAGRTLDIYGSNEAYTSPTELYGDNLKGTKLGSIVKGTSTELEIIGDFAYIGMRSSDGAMYLTDITITWEK